MTCWLQKFHSRSELQEYRPHGARGRRGNNIDKADYHWYWWRGLDLVHISCVIPIAHCILCLSKGKAQEVPSIVPLLEQSVEMR
jgi:hypothetical protein